MRVRFTLSKRPDLPTGWEIHNAPRPLAGHKTWTGDFLAGVFYAALDPAAGDYAVMAQRNAQLDATRLVYVTADEAITDMVVYYQSQQPQLWEQLQPDVTDPKVRQQLLNTWLNKSLGRPQDGDKPVAATIEVEFAGQRRPYTRLGVGAYPYPCRQQETHPTAVIYHDAGKGAWVASVDLEWSEFAGCYVYTDW